MSDYYEVDFIDVNAKKSGDAIALRYRKNGSSYVHVTDGGYLETGEKLIEHIKQYYNNPGKIDNVILTHPDGDHAAGLRKLFEQYTIDALWMLRPWNYVDVLIDSFSRFTSKENLEKRLKDIYPNVYELEKIAQEYGVPIYEPFQGTRIGEFLVLSPSKGRYLQLIIESEKTPESAKVESVSNFSALTQIIEKARKFIKVFWGDEYFPEEDTSSENNMSVVQFAVLCGERILLTGDAGRLALNDSINYANSIGIKLPGVDRIQIPHHGSRHNVSSEILDRLLGERLRSNVGMNAGKFTSIVSASREDDDHPRKAVVRAFIHRGGKVVSNEGNKICINRNSPARAGWGPATPLEYPEEQEN